MGHSERGPEDGNAATDAGWSERGSKHNAEGRGSVPTPIWVGLVVALALVTRLWGINWQLPSLLYYDELKYVEWAIDKVDGKRLGPTDFRNPSLVRHLFSAEFWLTQRLRPVTDLRERAVFRLALARVTIALLGVGAVIFCALTAQALFGGAAGLVSGLLLALSPLHVHFSHIAVNDVAASFFLAASLLAGVISLRRPGILAPVLAGLLAGLATSAKYNFGIGLLVPLLGLLVHRVNGRFQVPRVFVDTCGATLVAFAVGCFIGMPEIVGDVRGVAAGVVQQAREGRVASDDQEPTPVPLLYAETVLRGVGPLGAVAAAAGGVVLIRQRPGGALALLTLPAVYLIIMLRGELYFARFALPIVLLACVLAGGAAGLLSRRGPTAAGLAVILLSTPLVFDVVQYSRLAITPDTRVLADNWLRAAVGGDRVIAQVYSVPAEWSGWADTNAQITRYQSVLSPDVERRLECDGTRYVLLSNFNYERQIRRLPDPSAETGYIRLAQRAELVQHFSPFRAGRSAPAHPDDTAIPFWYMHAYERPGPVIDVYRFPDSVRAECPANLRVPGNG